MAAGRNALVCAPARRVGSTAARCSAGSPRGEGSTELRLSVNSLRGAAQRCHVVAMNRRIGAVRVGTTEKTAGSSFLCHCSRMRSKSASRKGFRASGLRLFDSRRLHSFSTATSAPWSQAQPVLPRCRHADRASAPRSSARPATGANSASSSRNRINERDMSPDPVERQTASVVNQERRVGMLAQRTQHSADEVADLCLAWLGRSFVLPSRNSEYGAIPL